MQNDGKDISEFEKDAHLRLSELSSELPTPDIPESLWETIEAGIPPPEKKDRKRFLPLLLFGLGAAYLFYSWYSDTHTQSASQYLVSSEPSSIYSKDDKETTATKKITTVAQTAPPSSPIVPQIEKADQIKKSIARSRLVQSNSRKDDNAQREDLSKSEQNSAPTEDALPEGDLTVSIDEPPPIKSNISTAHWLEAREILPLETFLLSEPPVGSELRPLESSASSTHTLTMYATLNSMRGSMSSEYTQLLAPFDFYQTRRIGPGIGIEYSYQVSSRWRAYGGISYDRYHIKTGHSSTVVYDQSTETQVGDDLVSRYRETFATPYGTVSSDVSLRRSSSSSIDQGSDIRLAIAMDQYVSKLSIPVGVSWSALHMDRWDISPRLGVRAGMLIGDVVSVSDISTSSELLSSDGIVTTGLTDLRQITWSMDLGLGSRYHLSERIAISADIVYTRDLTPSYRTSTYQTGLTAWSMRVGFSYFLKK